MVSLNGKCITGPGRNISDKKLILSMEVWKGTAILTGLAQQEELPIHRCLIQ